MLTEIHRKLIVAEVKEALRSYAAREKLTIEKIKNHCIATDIQNINLGIGSYVDGEVVTFRSKEDVEKFYNDISFRELLHIYSEYKGLRCYKDEEPLDYRISYSLDIVTILDNL